MTLQSPDPNDQDLDGIEDAETLEEQADANRPYGEVTAEDLNTQDLIDDGGDLARALDHTDADAQLVGGSGVQPLDEEIELDRDRHQTIEDRILQEEYDPASAIVPPDAPA